jgi:hypothetical protein
MPWHALFGCPIVASPADYAVLFDGFVSAGTTTGATRMSATVRRIGSCCSAW